MIHSPTILGNCQKALDRNAWEATHMPTDRKGDIRER